ncbi:MAG TPA: hypothetical protein VGQ09_05060 [Chitinophagaceae bacterium]|nr:hypothetical protein [Chitinophagaceae bacterium]
MNFGSPGSQKKKYNGIDWQSDLGLNEYDAQLRDLDGQIGRWWQIDPKIENMEMWSPYASNYDNPIIYSDPSGDEPQCCKDLWDEIKSAAKETWNSVSSAYVEVAKWTNDNLNPLATAAELVTGKTVNSNFTESKPRGESLMQLAAFVNPEAKGEFIVANTVGKNLVKAEVKEVTETAIKNETKQAVEKKAASHTDFVVTEKGTAIPIPDKAKGPSSPNKGSGMSYQEGSGGKGMDNKVTGVRIMDANKNQGRRVNYMNKEGQTVDPKTGKTISNKDPRGHIPVQ